MMTASSPMERVEVELDRFVSPFEKQQSQKWSFSRLFSCCGSRSSGLPQMSSVDYDDGLLAESPLSSQAYFKNQLASPPPTPILMCSTEKKEGGNKGPMSKDPEKGFNNNSTNAYSDVKEDKDVQLILVLHQTEVLRQKIDYLQKENNDLRFMLATGSVSKPLCKDPQ